MKTYLAGARLLLERGRGEEALTSFGRIDDLLDRMGTITRQSGPSRGRRARPARIGSLTAPVALGARSLDPL